MQRSFLALGGDEAEVGSRFFETNVTVVQKPAAVFRLLSALTGWLRAEAGRRKGEAALWSVMSEEAQGQAKLHDLLRVERNAMQRMWNAQQVGGRQHQG